MILGLDQAENFTVQFPSYLLNTIKLDIRIESKPRGANLQDLHLNYIDLQ